MSNYTQKGYLAHLNKDGSFDDTLIPLIFDKDGVAYSEDNDRDSITKHYANGEEWNAEDIWEVKVTFKKIKSI